MFATLLNKNTDDSSLLLSRIAHGNEQAMERFYKTYQGQILAYAKSRLQHYEDAIEIVNEVMLEVWRGKNRFKNKSKVSTWLFGIAHHKVVDKIRKLERQQAKSPIENKDDNEHTPASDTLLERYQDQLLIKKSMKFLSQAQQQVLYLVFYKDMGYPEIAKILGCPEGTVKTRVLYAKQKIRAELERADI